MNNSIKKELGKVKKEREDYKRRLEDIYDILSNEDDDEVDWVDKIWEVLNRY